MTARPYAEVVSVRTDGRYANAVTVACIWCGGHHTHAWNNETDSFRAPTCGALGSYAIRVGVREKVDAMRNEYPVPDGVVGLVPLHIGYAYEADGDNDVIGVVMDTSLGGFVVWMPLPTTVQLAAQLVAIAEDREALRQRYIERQL
jgi:hypothetical protein